MIVVYERLYTPARRLVQPQTLLSFAYLLPLCLPILTTSTVCPSIAPLITEETLCPSVVKVMPCKLPRGGSTR